MTGVPHEPARSVDSTTTARRRRRGTGHERDRHRAGRDGPSRSAAATCASGPCSSALRAAGVEVHVGHDRRLRRTGATPVTASTAVPANNIELDEAAKPGIAVLTRAGMLASICAQAKSLGCRRHARQDHDDVDADADPGRGRAAAELRHRRRRHRHGHRRAVDRRRVVGRRGRRERRHPSRAAAVRHDPDQRRGRSSRPLRHRRGDRRRLRRSTSRQVAGPKVLCIDDPVCAELAGRHGAITYGTSPGGRLPRRRRSRRARVVQLHRRARPARRSAPSTCRCAAFTTCATHWARWRWRCAVGVDFDVAARALAKFGGVARRFDIRGVDGGATLVDDYAHLPSEISAVLSAARTSGDGWRRVVAVFQPNRFNRMVGDVAGVPRRVRRRRPGRAHRHLRRRAPRRSPASPGKLVVNAVLDAHPIDPRGVDAAAQPTCRLPRRRAARTATSASRWAAATSPRCPTRCSSAEPSSGC